MDASHVTHDDLAWVYNVVLALYDEGKLTNEEAVNLHESLLT